MVKIRILITKKSHIGNMSKYYPANLAGEIDLDSKEFLVWWMPADAEIPVLLPKVIAQMEVELK